MASSMVVPVIDVQNDNFMELWPAMVLAIKTSSFLALDTELSGLGSRKALLAECIEDRYKAICHAARTRSVLSLGIACYKKLENKPSDTYLVQVYNLTLLCTEEYIIEPQSVQFLVQHGFDFNKQYAQGIPYYKGNDKGGNVHGHNMRTLFLELLRARKPLVLHNGLIDMVFLYQCFYAHLPERLGTFTADLSQMFPAGVFDTKYATEYELRFAASYLEYAYKKCKLENSKTIVESNSSSNLFLEFCNYSGHLCSYVDYRPCSEGPNEEGPLSVCLRFSAYGWCPNGSECPMSHDTDLIIQQDEKNKEDKRKRRKRKKKQKANREEEAEASPASKQPRVEASPASKQPRVEASPESKQPRVEASPESKQPRVEASPESKQPRVEASPASKQPRVEASPASKQPRVEASPASKQPRVEASPASKQPRVEDAEVPGEMEPATEAPQVSTTALAEAKEDNVTDVHMPADEGAPERQAAPPNGTPGKTEIKHKKMEGGTHRAGFDAFMTGYIFSYVSSQKGNSPDHAVSETCLPNCTNKLYLSGKSVPLQIVKSTFSKSSKAHTHKMEVVWGKS